MRIVLLSGGSGKRLWPISNDARSKQFLKVLKNEDKKRESMIQRVWEQLKCAKLEGISYIATNKAQVEMIQNQLGTETNLIVEPERRDTFPAIALAVTYLYSVEKVSKDEVIVVIPVDPYVEQGFFEKLKELEQVILSNEADLALIGVNPIYPSEKYGYIVPDVNGLINNRCSVSHFREKPTQDQALKLIGMGALWNCGVFAFKLDKIISILRDKNYLINYEDLLHEYASMPKISFDYEVLEKSENIIALSYNGYWKDLGTWNTLTEEMTEPLLGKGVISGDSVDVHVINELDIPVVVLGLSNIIVAASPDGILVSEINASPRVKDIAEFGLIPMYEERRWGYYRILDYAKTPGEREVITKKVVVKADKNLSYHFHYNRNEIWTILSGKGEFVLNDKLSSIYAGQVVEIPAGSKHGIRAITDLEFIEVQYGNEIIEEDINRIFLSWDELMKHIL
ncbi:mannose-1-phosphate guanylyltransferase [Paenibacillus sp. P3E]|uniref:sugar phosphate nucleotidyltransferase n=1 Tax=Paenibacillus sp. P3E TaxID=1349435 RepID=UPI00093DCB3F|nr:sugar phosphate nucleotidyltransferase [Paenibacillus sp. P3E]OKP83292.1 mannose-1-phosphate guanylyltransferase [Paenibacillus sp. P3E]